MAQEVADCQVAELLMVNGHFKLAQKAWMLTFVDGKPCLHGADVSQGQPSGFVGDRILGLAGCGALHPSVRALAVDGACVLANLGSLQSY